MNYYKRHIGDYAKKAGHLSILETGIYTLLLDAYYDREQGPTKAEAVRWSRARSPEELAALDAVLADFFTFDGERFIQSRVEEEFAKAAAQAAANAANGKRGGRPRKQPKTDSVSVDKQNDCKKKPNPPIHQSTNPKGEKEPSPPVPKRAKTPEHTFPAWVESIGDDDAIRADDPIFDWASKTGVPADWIGLAWWVFEGRYSDSPKKYADWRAVFRKAVREDWLKVWRLDSRDNRFVLTTTGELARREMEATA